MSCEHEWVAVGTKKFCVKCGQVYGVKPQAKKAPAKKKAVSTAKAE